MDFSEEYLKMCNTAPELQSEWYVTNGDFFYYMPIGVTWLIRASNAGKDEIVVDIAHHWTGDEHITPERPDCVWLPRQDQLQSMVARSGERCFALLEKLWVWWIGRENQVGYCQSLEQLWLALVMKDKFNKVWGGTEWVGDSPVLPPHPRGRA